ncbi:MAG: molybdopterin-dependent oxidoreductase [Deltaproteobacteria bacterium]|nr:molybdopterin-dependent oxidoreductase [Deltaproteobacteria bacterium]
MATYGTIRTGNSREDLLNSKLVIMWGWNPANTIQDPETSLYLAKVREKGIKIVAVDPRYTDSAATFAHQWIPVRPGTDAAMLIAMAYVIISEDLHNKKFIETHTVGFEKYKNYVLGKEDGEPKTPQWAESITSVSADVIVKLAREYATKKPAALIAGWGPARTAMGEQYSRAANVLTAITGNMNRRLESQRKKESRGNRYPRNGGPYRLVIRLKMVPCLEKMRYTNLKAERTLPARVSITQRFTMLF